MCPIHTCAANPKSNHSLTLSVWCYPYSFSNQNLTSNNAGANPHLHFMMLEKNIILYTVHEGATQTIDVISVKTSQLYSTALPNKTMFKHVYTVIYTGCVVNKGDSCKLGGSAHCY